MPVEVTEARSAIMACRITLSELVHNGDIMHAVLRSHWPRERHGTMAVRSRLTDPPLSLPVLRGLVQERGPAGCCCWGRRRRARHPPTQSLSGNGQAPPARGQLDADQPV